jgi:hypothetical protein
MRKILLYLLIGPLLVCCERQEKTSDKVKVKHEEFLDYYFQDYFIERHTPSGSAARALGGEDFVKKSKEGYKAPKMLAKEYIGDDTMRKLVEAVSNGIFQQYGDADTLMLTESERQTVIDGLTSLKEKKLDSTFYKTVNVISDDSLKVLLPDEDFASWQKFREANENACIYSFTRPVFLRNNTICFFYYSERCGDLCCEGNFQVYRKTANGWEPYLTLYSWIS